ncbi:MAG: alpha/beta fold hydrolase [Actinobacteria bacterium]|nr:alpha/beta fold hydrolase [Actinomycetota bacterium]
MNPGLPSPNGRPSDVNTVAPAPTSRRRLRVRRPRGRRQWIVSIVVLGALIALVTAVAVSRTTTPVRSRSGFIAGTAEPGGAAVQLDTTVYFPQHTPAPAVLLAHGFGGSKNDLDGQAKALARHGYVVLAYTARGFGRSGGMIHLDAPDYEVADASKLITYLASLPEVEKDKPGDPRVGVAGSSYGGGLALLTAAYDSRVDAVAADITWNSLTHALFPNAAGDSPGVFKKLWAGELFQSGTGARASAAIDATSLSAGQCGRFAPELCAAYQRAAQTGHPDAAMTALLAASSPAGVLGRIHAPTLLSQGEQDSLFPLTEADANARGIAATGTTVKVIWRAGGHDGGTTDSEIERDLYSWFDPTLRHHGKINTTFELNETGAGISSETGERVAQTLQVDSGYPAIDGHRQSTAQLTVSGPSQPVNAPAGGNPAAVTDVPGLGALAGTAATLSSLTGTSTTGLTAIPGQAAFFASAPLTDRRLIAGAPTVTFTITPTSTTDATLFLSLHDVSADGSDTLPAQLVAPLQLSGLSPGQPTTVTARLPAIVTDVAAGHRLVLSIATTDLAYQLPSDPRTYVISLAGGQAPLTLPSVDGRVVRGGNPGAWLIVGIVAVILAIALGVARSVRRRIRSAVRAELAEVPVAVTNLVKEYKDGYRAVDDVSFRVEQGQVVGLLGPNGAGKTTTLRVLMGLIAPTAGEVRVFGERIEPGAKVLARIGAFIEGPGFLPHLSGRENLRLYWAATGRPVEEADFETALGIAGLGSSIERRVKTYSHGMTQRLAIAQAMLGLPELLVLDEPTNGLDPPQIAEMREVLQSYARTGRTVIVSSHLLAEVEQTCTHVVVMHRGQLIAAGSVPEIAGAAGMQLAVTDVERATAALAAAGIASQAVPARRALEDVFLDLVGGGEA